MLELTDRGENAEDDEAVSMRARMQKGCRSAGPGWTTLISRAHLGYAVCSPSYDDQDPRSDTWR